MKSWVFPRPSATVLAGVGAQYDSELVYHNVKKEVAEQGVIYTDLESAMHGPYAEMIRTHFMHLVPPTDHKFAALHGAVWSGGSFVYVPPACACGDSPAVLFPPERPRRWPV